MATKACSCGADKETGGCAACPAEELLYWCDSCQRSVAEKRCQFCGLKARKKR